MRVAHLNREYERVRFLTSETRAQFCLQCIIFQAFNSVSDLLSFVILELTMARESSFSPEACVPLSPSPSPSSSNSPFPLPSSSAEKKRKVLKFVMEDDLVLLKEVVAAEDPFSQPYTHPSWSAIVRSLVLSRPRMAGLVLRSAKERPRYWSDSISRSTLDASGRKSVIIVVVRGDN